MEHRLDILGGEYALILDHQSSDVLIGHIEHVDRKGKHGFGRVDTPVGHLAAHIAPATEYYRSHWSVELAFRSDVRYEQASQTTTIVASPERQAGQYRRLLRRLVALRDSSLPFYHPDLPRDIGRALLEAQLCCEPMGVTVRHFVGGLGGLVLHFGQISDDE